MNNMAKRRKNTGKRKRNERLEPSAHTEVSPARIRELLDRPDSFGYSGGNEEMFETWTIGPVIETRDSDILTKANRKALETWLESDASLADDYEIMGASHWAVGWVDHLNYRVVDENGEPTRIALLIEGWFDALSDYPVADDELYSEMEYEATLANIEDASRGLRDDVPDDWAGQMFTWFWNNDQSAVENADGQGGYPSDEEFEQAARALGFWDTSEDAEANPGRPSRGRRKNGCKKGGTWNKPTGPERMRNPWIDDPMWATTAGAFLGSFAGLLPGYVLGSGAIMGLGSLAGGAAGGYMGAPADRKSRGAWGGGIGGGLAGPLGAGIGGLIGGRKPGKKRKNPSSELKRKLLR